MTDKNKLMKLCFKAGAMQMALNFLNDKKILDGADIKQLEFELSSLKEFIHPHLEDEDITLDAFQSKDNPNSYKV